MYLHYLFYVRPKTSMRCVNVVSECFQEAKLMKKIERLGGFLNFGKPIGGGLSTENGFVNEGQYFSVYTNSRRANKEENFVINSLASRNEVVKNSEWEWMELQKIFFDDDHRNRRREMFFVCYIYT